MAMLVIFSTILLCGISLITAANILAIFPLPSPSHHIWNSPLVVSLARNGHNVTVVSQLAQKNTVPNLTDFVVPELLAVEEDSNFVEMVGTHPLTIMDMFMEMMSDSCLKIQKSDSWSKLINYPEDTKFDLVIIEPMGAECLLGGIFPRFGNPPIVAINAFNVPPWLFEMTGSPNIVSNIPHHMLAVTDRMTFFERIQNFYYNIYTFYRYHYNYLPDMEKAAQEFYGPGIPSFYKIRESVRLGLASFHPVLDHPYASTVNLIPVAGIQIEKPKPLPQGLQQFLDGAKDGAVFFSLGSNIQGHKLPIEKLKVFLKAFAEIPQRVLWKFEADSLPEQPKNVKIGKWLPQSDILAHPNIKVFITHSGLLSTHEAIYRGVPVIGIPIFAEQPINIQKMINHGSGIRLDYNDLTKESLLQALKTVLYNKSYTENIKMLSALFRDEEETPLQRAVFWTEYIIKHKGAIHLQPAAKDLNIIQYILLDVIAFLLAIPMLFIFVLYCSCRRKQASAKKKQY